MRSVNREPRASLHCFSYISHNFLHTQKHMTRMQTRRISSVQRDRARVRVTAMFSKPLGLFFFASFTLSCSCSRTARLLA